MIRIEQGNAGREITATEAETLLGLLRASRSENTNLAYARNWKAFVGWCKEQGFTTFPAQPATVALYLSHLNGQGKRASTLTQNLAAITAAHNDGGQGFDYFKNHLVAASLSAARRSMATDGRSSITKPRAFNQSEILSMVRALPPTQQGKRDRALLLLGMNAGLRASEYANLRAADIVFDEHGMDVLISVSKGDQFGSGQPVYVGGLAPSQHELDAVKAMKEWLGERQTLSTGDGRLFIAFRKGGMSPHLNADGVVHGLTRQAITDVVVRASVNAGITGRKPSSHSLRHSFITQAFRKHLDAVRISKVSRHKNLRTLMEYDQSSRKENPISPSLWA